MIDISKPAQRPANPRFSSGPCAKYPAFNLQQLESAPLGRSHRAAVGKDKQVVKNSAEDAKWTVAGGKTPPAETTNDLPMGVKSPMTTVKRPPKPATGFRK